MEDLVIHTVSPTLHWEDNTSCIYVVEVKQVTIGVKHIETHVYFIQEQFENGIFVPKYEKSSVMSEDMCTKPFSGPIISWSTKYMTGFIFIPTSDTEHHQLMRLHEFFLN